VAQRHSVPLLSAPPTGEATFESGVGRHIQDSNIFSRHKPTRARQGSMCSACVLPVIVIRPKPSILGQTCAPSVDRFLLADGPGLRAL